MQMSFSKNGERFWIGEPCESPHPLGEARKLAGSPRALAADHSFSLNDRSPDSRRLQGLLGYCSSGQNWGKLAAQGEGAARRDFSGPTNVQEGAGS
jgi:hypothetical protein